MHQVEIIRQRTSDHGTEGICRCITAGFSSFTLELPWRGNRSNISCIPAGTYICRLVQSPRFGFVFQVLDVEGRTHILNHSGNLAGDIAKGLKTHVKGCILHGTRRGVLQGQRAVLLSRPVVRKLRKALGDADFTLTITEEF